MSPGKKEGVPCEKDAPRKTSNTGTVTDPAREGKLAPANVIRLQNLSAHFQRRPGSHDIVTACPKCGGKLVIDETEKFFICFGPITCEVRGWRFDALFVALGKPCPAMLTPPARSKPRSGQRGSKAEHSCANCHVFVTLSRFEG